MPKTTQLGTVAGAISKRFQLVDDKPQLTDEAFAQSEQELAQIPEDQRKQVAVELLALAIEINEVGSEAAEQALAQLYLLCAQVLGDYFKAQKLFASQNVDLSSAAKLIDNHVKKRPVKTGPLSQGNNLFSLLKSNKK